MPLLPPQKISNMQAKTKTTWRTVRLGDFASVNPPVRLERGKEYPFMDMTNVVHLSRTTNWLERKTFTGSGARFDEGDTLFARITPCLENGKITQVRGVGGPGFGSTEFYVLRGKEKISDNDFIFYLTRTYRIRKLAEASMLGASGRQRVERAAFENIDITIPEDIDEQKHIAEILSAFDDKIENNNRIIETLEQMAQAIFKEWFVKFRFHQYEKIKFVDSPLGKIPKGWKIKALDEVADFLNGIALQNFRPKDTESNLPVIKIREMNNDIDSNTERASRDIDEKYKVNAGDILFSWSGSLELMRWSATTGALNQHLFKVTSQNYPTWFVFYWVKHHLPYFKLIASSKATSMGHIQRHHLSEATAVVPSPDILDQADKLIFPMFEQALKLRIENQELAAMRDLLLPRLMSGEIEINI